VDQSLALRAWGPVGLVHTQDLHFFKRKKPTYGCFYRFTNEEDGKMLRRYWTAACQNCSIKSQCTTGPERRITRWEDEHLLEVVQQRLDSNPQAMRQRRETVEHPFKARMGATHFLTKTLPKVAAEMALTVLAYNLTRVMNIVGIKPLIHAIAA
jgi:macrodomain Ter protein organizer (MatP/YcbG family)